MLGLRPAPEFEAWLAGMGLFDRETGGCRELEPADATLRRLTGLGTRAALSSAGPVMSVPDAAGAEDPAVSA